MENVKKEVLESSYPVTDEDIDNFMASFIPWGYMDIKKSLESYRKAGKTDDELTEAVQSFMDDVEAELDKIDVCYIAYDSLQQEARIEIESATGKDISNDKPYYNVTVYGNYMLTDFEGTEEAREATKKLIDTMKEKSEVVKWYYNQL